jgi:DNA-binding XRE family transcriptional regulator
MPAASVDILPSKLRRNLAKLGADIALARRKRKLTVNMMAERIGTSRATYLRAEKGDPRVSMGVYAMALFVLGLSEGLAEIADVRKDDAGLLLDAERLPKRVRIKKTPTPL